MSTRGSAIAPSLRKTKSWPTTWAFTDWLLFERPYRHGKTLLELYVDEPPASLSPVSLKRLEQVRDTQYFSRFGILDKDPANGMVALKDTRADRRFDVYDPHIVQKEHWSDGAIAVRLACIDDVWLTAGQLYLYDIARLSDTAVDGPGAVHPEDLQDGFDTSCVSFFLRLVRDIMGAQGRYVKSLNIYEQEWE